MSALPVDALQKITGTVRDHEVSFVNGIVVVVTLSGEEVFRKVAFECPCTQPASHIYGSSFIWAPALVLFVISVLINNVTWRLVQGCLHRSRSTSHGPRRGCMYAMSVIGRSLVAPSAWIFVSLIDGSYYTCMLSTTPCIPITNSTENRELLAESQVLAWFFIVTVILLVLIALLVSRCMDKFTYVQNKYIEAYQELEQTKFDEVMRTRAGNLAEMNVHEFFDKEIRMKEDWDAISVAPLCDVHWVKKPQVLLKRKHIRFGRIGGNFPEPYFTPLHKWANDERRKRPVPDDQQMQLISLQMSPTMPFANFDPIGPQNTLDGWHGPPPDVTSGSTQTLSQKSTYVDTNDRLDPNAFGNADYK